VLAQALEGTVDAGTVVVSPDMGRVAMAADMAGRLGLSTGLIEKRREDGANATVLGLIGDVHDRPCLIVDDMISAGDRAAARGWCGSRGVPGSYARPVPTGPELALEERQAFVDVAKLADSPADLGALRRNGRLQLVRDLPAPAFGAHRRELRGDGQGQVELAESDEQSKALWRPRPCNPDSGRRF
jgi:hypothetical protein